MIKMMLDWSSTITSILNVWAGKLMYDVIMIQH